MSLSPHRYTKVKYHIKGVTEFVEQYFKLIKWKKNSRIVDLGTGSGHLLAEVEPLFPKDYAEILGIDKLQKMVDYFNSRKKTPRMKAMTMDIETTKLPEELKGRFDFAFSCNSIMYWADIRQSFTNVSQLLNQSGQIFFIFPKRGDVHDIFRALSGLQMWAPYTSEFKNWTNYFDTKSPTDTMRNELERVNIEVLKSEVIKCFFEDEDKRNFMGMFDSLDYISERIPKSNMPRYKEDYYKFLFEKLIYERSEDNKMKWRLPFEYIVVAAKKA